MSKIKCKLIAYSNSVFLQQIYTGYFLLHKNKLIDLEQITIRENKSTLKKTFSDRMHNNIRVILNDRIMLHYDLKDGRLVSQKDLDESHYYFKRSYHPEYIESIGKQKEKIFPYGLNYSVYPSNFDKFALKRNIFLSYGARKITTGLGSLDTMNLNRFQYLPRLNEMQSLPDYDAPPKIIFMVKSYDPHDNPDRSKLQVEERIQINETRAECIRLLQAEFGNNFYGGFYHTKISTENYRKYLIPEKSNSSKRNYVNLLKQYPICIASAGLHGSIGWKLAEYIALSKAIVTEKMNFKVTGNLQKDINYLEFTSPKECLDKSARLFQDKNLRNDLMTNNAKYYNAYLRPDALIMNTILVALSEYNKLGVRLL